MIIARSCSHNLMRARPRGADHRELSLDHAWIVLDTLDQMLLDLPDAALERATVADGKRTSPLAAMKSVSLVPPTAQEDIAIGVRDHTGVLTWTGGRRAARAWKHLTRWATW